MNRTLKRLLSVGLVSACILASQVTVAHAGDDTVLTGRDAIIARAKAEGLSIPEPFVANTAIKASPSRSTTSRAASSAGAVTAAAVGCATSGLAPFGMWGPVATAPCGIFGSPNYSVAYNWTVPWWSSASICTKAWGFANLTTGTWYGAGCGSYNNSAVPWGNVLAAPKMMGYAYQGTGQYSYSAG
jgi:hypothetical protein